MPSRRLPYLWPILTGSIIISVCSYSVLYSITSWNSRVSSTSHVFAFILGLLILPFLKIFIAHIFKSRGEHINSNHGSKMYNLDHGRLNLSMPPPSMWMNMGYWKNTDDLPIACKSLLEEVLSTANLTSTPTPWSLIDLGFGCGDQTALIAENSMSEKYVGITLDAQQFSYAESRLQSRKLLKLPFVQLFCADAGNPGEWSEELKRAIFECLEETTGEKWFLALDTAYHFKPDRWGVIQHASREQDASFMAFDLVLADKISSFQSLLMRLVTTLMGTPWANFVTEAEYRQMLVKCGYTEENITIRDISRHVFTPLVTFLERRDRELNSIGLSLGKFRAAGWLFKWWGRTGIIRGCIIVARKRPEDYLK